MYVLQKALTRVVLLEKGLTCLPDCIGSLTQLARLDADTNSLEYIPDSIGSLKSLQWL